MKLAWILALSAAARTAAADDAVPVFAGPHAWTVEIIDRPLTLRGGMFGGALELGVARTLVVDPILGDMSIATAETSALAARYGITSRLEAGVAYALALHPFEAKGALAVQARFGVLDDERRKLAPAASLVYGLDTEIAEVRAGAAALYKLTPRLAVLVPPDLVRITIKTPIGRGVPLPRPADIRLPVGLGLQATEHLFATLETRLLTIGIQDSDTTFLFADVTPFTARLFYSPSNRLDVGATLDVQNAPDIGDIFTIAIVVQLFTR